MAYITCKDMTLGYDGKTVSEQIDFQVNEGDYLCIVGENGAGKSTLIKTLLHLLKPIEGQVVTGDGLQPFEIGYLPQQTDIQKDFPASVWEIVLSGLLSKCGNRPYYRKEEKQIAENNMKRLSIWELRKKSYRKLSGGQQQRVLLARALCATTKLLILDEPVTGLDPKVTADFYEMLEKINRENTSIIMVSHDIHAAIPYASHILHIGRTQLFFGTKDKYLKSDAWKMFQTAGGNIN